MDKDVFWFCTVKSDIRDIDKSESVEEDMIIKIDSLPKSSDCNNRFTIEDYIHNKLSEAEQLVALDFIKFLSDHNLAFHKDNGGCWINKIYYWVKLRDKCVCFIAIKDPDEPTNNWTVWSDDMSTEWLANYEAENCIKEIAWKHIDHCGHCGSCGGGRHKIVFGKEFNDVCGCTFRVDNPNIDDLIFLKKMVEIRIDEIQNYSK